MQANYNWSHRRRLIVFLFSRRVLDEFSSTVLSHPILSSSYSATRYTTSAWSRKVILTSRSASLINFSMDAGLHVCPGISGPKQSHFARSGRCKKGVNESSLHFRLHGHAMDRFCSILYLVFTQASKSSTNSLAWHTTKDWTYWILDNRALKAHMHDKCY